MPDTRPEPRRFLTIDDVARELATSHAQVYALVRRSEQSAIRLGGRGQWRVGRNDLEAYIERAYDETTRFVAETPFSEAECPSKGMPASAADARFDVFVGLRPRCTGDFAPRTTATCG